MCGLVGIAGKFITKQDAEVLRVLLHLDVLRGRDSTGIGLVYDLDHLKREPFQGVVKSVGLPEDLYKEHPKLFHGGLLHYWGLNVAIGHNRWATQGAVNADNAHPFDFPDLIGVHNGTVRKDSLKKFHEAEKFDVDSQMIFSHLNHTGKIQDVWDEADGAMALVWWDKKKSTLNFVRNKERPLFYAFSEFGGRIYWASESWMLGVACGRSDVKIKEILPVKENVHYQFTLKNSKIEVVETPLEPFRKTFVVVELPKKENKQEKKVSRRNNFDNFVSFKIVDWVPSNSKEDSGWANGVCDDGRKIKVFTRQGRYKAQKAECEARGNDQKYFTESAYACKDKAYDFTCLMEYIFPEDIDFVLGWNREVLTQEVYKERVKYGCANCTGEVSWEERREIAWEARDAPICSGCIKFGYYDTAAYSAYTNFKH